MTMPDADPRRIMQLGDPSQSTAITGVRRCEELAEDRRMDDDNLRRLVCTLFEHFAGRFSSQVGIDVDDGDREIERWFLASTLFGNRIDSNIAIRTYRVLDGNGLSTIADVASCDRDRLVEFLDRGGYVRYDYRMASRLLALAENADRLLPHGVGVLGNAMTEPDRLRAALEALPGWGPVTARAFLRELRGVWPGADLPVDPLAARAALHIGLAGASTSFDLDDLVRCAVLAAVDVRDLEAALVRTALAHHRSFGVCEARSPEACEFLAGDDRPVDRFPIASGAPAGPAPVVRIDSRCGIAATPIASHGRTGRRSATE